MGGKTFWRSNKVIALRYPKKTTKSENRSNCVDDPKRFYFQSFSSETQWTLKSRFVDTFSGIILARSYLPPAGLRAQCTFTSSFIRAKNKCGGGVKPLVTITLCTAKVRYQSLEVGLEVLYYPSFSCLITIWRC